MGTHQMYPIWLSRIERCAKNSIDVDFDDLGISYGVGCEPEFNHLCYAFF